MQQFNPIEWALLPLKRYADFRGRSPRAEYWWYVLAAWIASLVLALVDQMLTGPIYGDLGPLGLIQSVVLIVPGAAVTVRRLHDANHSGWWFLLNLWSFGFLLGGSLPRTFETLFDRLPAGAGFVLILGLIAAAGVLLLFMITPGDEGPNRYGADPYGTNPLEEIFA